MRHTWSPLRFWKSISASRPHTDSGLLLSVGTAVGARRQAGRRQGLCAQGPAVVPTDHELVFVGNG